MVSRLSEVTGKEVFTEDGAHVGTVDDVVIDPETGRVLGILVSGVEDTFWKRVGVDKARGINVPYRAVKSVGDIVILKNIVYAAQSAP
ncbi:PRC-barrel domain-containing protein [Candidatus Pyrohabitans sp.]